MGKNKAVDHLSDKLLRELAGDKNYRDHRGEDILGSSPVGSASSVSSENENTVPAASLAPLNSSLMQAENMRMAQNRILELEAEVDRLLKETEEISSAAEVVRVRNEELKAKAETIEKEKRDIKDTSEVEILVLKGNLQHFEKERERLVQKIDELEIRLAGDFKKVRYRERELENRLELAKVESAALLRVKDENILDLKRRIDQLQAEAESYRTKCGELYKQIEANQEQFRRTVKTLRLALTNLEGHDDSVVPLKKAE